MLAWVPESIPVWFVSGLEFRCSPLIYPKDFPLLSRLHQTTDGRPPHRASPNIVQLRPAPTSHSSGDTILTSDRLQHRPLPTSAACSRLHLNTAGVDSSAIVRRGLYLLSTSLAPPSLPSKGIK